MENPLISIIVPVYNVEKYLKKCLDSLLNQTYRNIEIIIVNDGSPDDSQTIIDKYLQKDERINCVIQENGGLSSARNTGIENATGELLAFVDSDDWVEPDMIHSLYSALKKNKADIAICDVSTDFENGEQKTVLKQAEGYPDTIKTKENKDAFLAIDCFACNKLFKKKLFSDSNIKFPKGLLYEDIATFPRLFVRAQKITFVRKSLYHYIVRSGAITQTSFRLKGLDYLKVTEIIRQDFNAKFPSFTSTIKDFLIMHNFFSLSINCGYIKNNKERNQAFDIIQKYYLDNNISWEDIKKAGRNGRTFLSLRSKSQGYYYKLFWFANPLFRLALNLYHSIKK